MLTYNLTDIGSDSMYEYLYKCIKGDILSGSLPAGERLPSKRNFARNLGISVITVENAYGQLMAEGYIYSVPKKGFYVSNLKNVQVQESHRKIEPLVMETKREEYFADFSSNQTDTEVFPFTIWARTMREIIGGNQEQLMTNSPSAGILELRSNIARHLQDFRGMIVEPEQIVVGAGTEYLYSLLIQLLGKEVRYGVENPGYHKIARIFQKTNTPYCYVNLDRYGVPVEELLEKEVDVIHTSPSHHFPTGTIMPISRRYELLGWASGKENRYIIEDDYDSELRLIGKPIPTLQSIDLSDRVIYINTFTKTLASTVRISYMVLPQSLVGKFYSQLGFYSCTVSNFEQYTLARFIENGSFEKHLNRLRNFYQNKRDQIMEVFSRKPLGGRISITEENAGVHFLMKLLTDKAEQTVVQEALNQGIKLVPMSHYYVGREEAYHNIYVMNYSSLKMDRMDEIARRLYEVLI